MPPKNSVRGVYSRGNTYIYQGREAQPPPLTSPFRPTDRPASSTTLLGGLRATERRVPLIGREQEIERALRWMREPAGGERDHRVMIIHGPGGAGKTRLAAEILHRATDEGWVAGFLSGNLRTYPDWPTLVGPSTPTMIAVDYAEARYDDLRVLFEDPPIGHRGDAPLRLILVIREGIPAGQSWIERLAHERRLPDRGRELLDESVLTVLSLERSLQNITDRGDLWAAAYATYATDTVPTPDYLEDEIFERPLFILLDAFRVFSQEGDSKETPTTASLMQAILGHEREYWRRSLSERDMKLDERGMNQVAVIATLVGGVDRHGFERALAAVDWLKSDHQLRLRVTDWWCLVYATEAGTIRGVEPDPVGEYLVAQSMNEGGDPRSLAAGSMAAENLTALIEAATLVGRQCILRVLTRIAASFSDPGHAVARSVLSELLGSHLDEFLPAALDPMPPIAEGAGEPLSMTVASAILASDKLELVAERSDAGRAGPEDHDPVESSIRPAALKVIRRQLDAVGRREFESDRWSAGRFASLIGWALRLDLEAKAIESAEQRVAILRDLEPRPHHPLASALTEMGRHHLSLEEPERAEPAFLEALEELRAAGDEDNGGIYVVAHELAETADLAGDRQLALERFKAAFEGKRRVFGLADEETQVTFSSLIAELAETDLEEAIELQTEIVEELEAQGAGEAVLRNARRNLPRAMLFAGRGAETRTELAVARSHYQDALDELGRLGESDGELAHILGHDLGDLADAEGESETALRLYEAALDGKSRLFGPEAWTTITTVLVEARTRARFDVDDALQRLEDYERGLDEIRPETLARLTEERIDILGNARRFDEASTVARRYRARLLRADLQLAIFDAAVDPTIETVPLATLAAEGCMLASLVFAPGDSRFLPLSSRLANVMLDHMTSLLGSQLAEETMEGSIFDQEVMSELTDQPGSTPVQVIESINKISGRDDLFVGFLRAIEQNPVTIQEWTRRAMREEMEDLVGLPLLLPLATAGDKAWNDIPRDAETRRWLARNTFVGFEFEDRNWREMPLGQQLTLYRALLSGVVAEAQMDYGLVTRAWEGEVDPPELTAIEHELAAELESSGQVTTGDGDQTVARARVHQIAAAGRVIAGRGDSAIATKLFDRALRDLQDLEQPDEVLVGMINNDLGEVALGEGNYALATERLRSAFEEMRGLVGLRDHATQEIFANLVRSLARGSLQAALDQVDAVTDDLEAEGSDAVTRREIQLNRARALLHAGHAKGQGGDPVAASALYQQSLERLAEVGEGDSIMAYGIIHNLAEIALADGDLKLAVDRYRAAFAGKRRLRGLVDSETIASLFGLVRTLARDDLDGALSELSAATAALESEGADEETVHSMRRERAVVMLEAGRAREDRRDFAGAASLYRRARTVVGDLGEADSSLARLLTHELGDAAFGEGKIDLAIRHYTESYEQGHRLAGLTDPNTLSSLSSLTRTLARDDLPGALAKLRDAALELESTGGDQQVLTQLRWDRTNALIEAGRASLEHDQPANAGEDFQRALAEVSMLGGEEQIHHHIIVHDLGDVALKEGDREGAIDRYRSSFDGKRRLRGLTDGSTQVTLGVLARAIAGGGDLESALALLDESAEELAREQHDGSSIHSLRVAGVEATWMAARARHTAGDLSGASDLYERATGDLSELGEGEGLLAHVIRRSHADVARAEGETDLAIELYSEAVEGMRATIGLRDQRTIGSITSLLDTLADRDLDQAVTRANACVVELHAVDPEGPAISSVQGWLARNAPSPAGPIGSSEAEII
jgi:tetratricopeptide (TPR) repeat protein